MAGPVPSRRIHITEAGIVVGAQPNVPGRDKAHKAHFLRRRLTYRGDSKGLRIEPHQAAIQIDSEGELPGQPALCLCLGVHRGSAP